MTPIRPALGTRATEKRGVDERTCALIGVGAGVRACSGSLEGVLAPVTTPGGRHAMVGTAVLVTTWGATVDGRRSSVREESLARPPTMPPLQVSPPSCCW